MTGYLIFAGVFFVVFFLIYNSLVSRKNEVENSLGAIHAYLKKRYDLIPNLVSSVKAYMKHEETILTEITKLRAQSETAPGTEEAAIRMDSAMSSLLGKLMVTVENYPEIKANENFIHMQRTLHEVEEQLSAARRTYNATVTRYNNGVEMLPFSLIASIMGYKKKPVFKTIELERVNPDLGKMFNIG